MCKFTFDFGVCGLGFWGEKIAHSVVFFLSIKDACAIKPIRLAIAILIIKFPQLAKKNGRLPRI